MSKTRVPVVTGECFLFLVGRSPLAWLASGLQLGNLWIVGILGKLTLFIIFIPECLKSAHSSPATVGLLGEGLKWMGLAPPPGAYSKDVY